MQQIERDVVAALRKKLRNPELRNKDVMEFSSGPVETRDGEIAVNVETLGMTWHCAVAAAADRRSS